MAPTSGRLILWLLIATAFVIVGQNRHLKPYHSEVVTSFVGGAIVATALASWTIDAKERQEEAALTRFWGAFSEGVCIVLPSFEPTLAHLDELSPFTLYHDAVASHAIQTFLQSRYGVRATVISSKQIKQPKDVPDQHLILIGGPNFNDVTKMFMKELWEKYDGSFFHWSSAFADDPSFQHLLQRKEDHLLKIESSGNSGVAVSEVMFDVPSPAAGHPAEARGMCVRAEGLLGEDRVVLLFAGVDTAFGTLAAARYLLDASNLVNIACSTVTQIVASAKVNGYNIGHSTALRFLHAPELRSEQVGRNS